MTHLAHVTSCKLVTLVVGGAVAGGAKAARAAWIKPTVAVSRAHMASWPAIHTVRCEEQR